MTRRPTDAELDAIEDAAQRADEARNDAAYIEIANRAGGTTETEDYPEWGDLPMPEPNPDEPVPHRSRWRPVAPAEE